VWVAEPFNTLAALFVVCLALFGLHQCAPQGHELRTRATYLALALVGVGAAVFHTTLLGVTELLHGLPVVFAGCVLLFSALTSQKEAPLGATEAQLVMCLGLYAAISTLSALMLGFNDVIPLVPIFAAIVLAALGLQSGRVYIEHQHSLDEAGAAPLGKVSLGIFSLALVFWLVESQYCTTIGVWNFHALWHCLEGVAGYLLCVFLSACRAINMGWDVNIRYWRSFVPVIVIDKDPVAYSMEF
jgi:dihydroceramidase